jgi:hypothetical protein
MPTDDAISGSYQLNSGRRFWADFAACAAWRLTIAVAFGVMGYLGGGGDGIVYHVLGMHAREVVFGIPGAPLADLLLQWSDDPGELAAKYSTALAELRSSGVGFFSSDTLAIILAHAAVYAVVPHPLAFTTLVASLSAMANAWLIHATGASGWARKLLIFNPLSAYFAATHLKEGIAEVLIIGLAITAWIGRKHIVALLIAVVAVAFRPAFLPICAVMLAARPLASIDSRLLVIVALAVVLLIPGLQWGLPQSEGGFVFSVVHANEVTRVWLGLLVGFGAPYPLPVGELGPFMLAMMLGGMVYWLILPRTLLGLATMPQAPPFVWVPVLLSAIIGYVVEGDLAAKTRFFSAFLPLLIAGWMMVPQAASPEQRRGPQVPR